MNLETRQGTGKQMAGRKPDPPFLVWHTSSGGTPAVGLVHRGVDGHSFPVLTRSYFPPPMSSGSSTVIPMMTPTHMQVCHFLKLHRIRDGRNSSYIDSPSFRPKLSTEFRECNSQDTICGLLLDNSVTSWEFPLRQGICTIVDQNVEVTYLPLSNSCYFIM